MREHAHADVAMMNGGGIRGGKVYEPGTSLTRRDVLNELPFNNRVVEIEVPGAALRQAVENGLSQLPNASGRFPQIAGMTVVADSSRPAGSRVISIKVGDTPLDDAKRYSVATNDFMARGGDGYTMFSRAPRLLPDVDAPLLANAVMDYIKGIGTIRSGVENRMVLR
jgi:2',3'-cyclic-nucleotide 2'-phosphodiesterase (5'-nucleotidase family)